MKTIALRWEPVSGWSLPPATITGSVQLILYFADSKVMAVGENAAWRELRKAHPRALCVGCSSAGEILNNSVADGGISAVLVHFDATEVRAEMMEVGSASDSAFVGEELTRKLLRPNLRHVLVLSDGLGVNGTALTAGLRRGLPAGVQASGGLAGDGAEFKRTLVGLGDDVASGRVVAVGFYGDHLKVEHGSAGGWKPFGPTRLITRSEGNVLYTLDDQPALELYKRYLGNLATGLPASGLLFPLELLATRGSSAGVVRTILAVNEADQSLTFAGDMPVGQYARLMKAGCEALVEGAGAAASQIGEGMTNADRLAVLVSCVGRKLVMNQRVEEEVEAVLERLGNGVTAAGFYSYGEICPSRAAEGCELHNQTMTLTVFAEKPVA